MKRLLWLLLLGGLMSCSSPAPALISLTVASPASSGATAPCGDTTCWSRLSTRLTIGNNSSAALEVVNTDFTARSRSGIEFSANPTFDGGCEVAQTVAPGSLLDCILQFNFETSLPEADLFPLEVRFRDAAASVAR